MFLVFTLVLLVVAVGIVSSVYSIFFPFMQNLWTVTQYHSAYYGAVSAVERAELGLRYRSPGFVWSWWFLGTGAFGPSSDYSPELSSGPQQWFWRTINSRTTTIPNAGMGNTDPAFSDSMYDSADYNQLWYTYLETFLLSYDPTAVADFYSSWSTSPVFFSDNGFTWVFRLPPKVHSWFGDVPGKLCDSIVGNCDPDGDGIFDDIALSWSMEWMYNGNQFKIFPTIAVFYYSGMQIDERMDNAIRESFINDTWNVSFGNSWTPVINGASLTKHTVVSAEASAIEWQSFKQIFTSTNYSGLRLSFGAANLFRTFTGAVYPYLEYQFTFPQPIADRFYMIEWHGRVGEYNVQIILKKPTVQWTIGGDFTVIF